MQLAAGQMEMVLDYSRVDRARGRAGKRERGGKGEAKTERQRQTER